jgi:hypothetical protein
MGENGYYLRWNRVMLEYITIILLGVLFTLLCMMAIDVYPLVRRLSINSLRSRISSNSHVLILTAIAIILSLLRGILVDPPIVVTDGYDYFAGQLSTLLSDWNYNIDESLVEYRFPFRLMYSLAVALLNVFISLDIVLAGKAISLMSFLVSIPLLNMILVQTGLFETKRKRDMILLLYITNCTIVTSLSRFGTDMLFVALLMAGTLLYLRFAMNDNEDRFWTLVKTALISILLFFTREVSILFIMAMVLHQFVSQDLDTKIKTTIFTLGAILWFTAVAAYLNILLELVYYVVWTATSYTYANALLKNGNLAYLLYPLLSKSTSVYNIITTIESCVYVFGVPVLVALVGVMGFLKDRPKRRLLLSHFLSLYFICFGFFYIFLKIGRGLDRFFLPVVFIPYLLVPAGLERMSSSCRDSQNRVESLKGRYRLLFVLLVISQLLVFAIRTILSYLGP